MVSNTRLDYVKLLLVKGDKGDKGDAGDGRELEAELDAEILARERADTTLASRISEVDGKVQLYEDIKQMVFALQEVQGADAQPTIYWMLDDDNGALFKLRFVPETGRYIFQYYDGTNWTTVNPIEVVDNKLNLYGGVQQLAAFMNNNRTEPTLFWELGNDKRWKLRFDATNGYYWIEYYDGTNWTTYNPIQTIATPTTVTLDVLSIEDAFVDGLDVTENTWHAYKCGKTVQVDGIVTITGRLPDYARLAYDFPAPYNNQIIRVEATARTSNYSQPLSIGIQYIDNRWTLTAIYGNASATAQNPTKYYIHFTYMCA